MTKLLQVVTNSELCDFRSCRALHGYGFHEMLRPVVVPIELNRGKLGHLGISTAWRAAFTAESLVLPLAERIEIARKAALGAMGEAYREADAAIVAGDSDAILERCDELAEGFAEACGAVGRYLDLCGGDFARMIPLAIERPCSMRMRNASGNETGVQYDGVVDLCLLDMEANAIRLEDHKFTGYEPSLYEGRVAMDTQLTGYLDCVRAEVAKGIVSTFWEGAREVWRAVENSGQERPAWEARGFRGTLSEALASARVDVVAFNVLKAKVVATPKINKDGSVSVAKIDTMPEIYAEALAQQVTERSIPINDKQRDLLESLRAKRDRWFARYEFTRSDDEIARWRAEVLAEAAQIRETGRRPELRTRNPGHCTGIASYACKMRSVCLDPTNESIRRLNYRIATDRHEEVMEAKNGSEKSSDQPNW